MLIINTTGLKLVPEKTTRLNNALYETQLPNLNPLPKTISLTHFLI
jgi:hypothetical protein